MIPDIEHSSSRRFFVRRLCSYEKKKNANLKLYRPMSTLTQSCIWHKRLRLVQSMRNSGKANFSEPDVLPLIAPRCKLNVMNVMKNCYLLLRNMLQGESGIRTSSTCSILIYGGLVLGKFQLLILPQLNSKYDPYFKSDSKITVLLH